MMQFQNEFKYTIEDKDIDRFRSKYLVDSISGCWLWQGKLDKDGYGRFSMNNVTSRAHRVSYEHFKRVKADGVLDHFVCDNRACVNPDHLMPTTVWGNTLRGNAPSAVNNRKTTCINGHVFDKVYTKSSGGKVRLCTKCRADYNAKFNSDRKNNGNS